MYCLKKESKQNSVSKRKKTIKSYKSFQSATTYDEYLLAL